jgi:type I restriction enzyme R subunit
MDEDPAFYRQFSDLLEETIRAYRERRLSEREYLGSVVDLGQQGRSKGPRSAGAECGERR